MKCLGNCCRVHRLWGISADLGYELLNEAAFVFFIFKGRQLYRTVFVWGWPKQFSANLNYIYRFSVEITLFQCFFFTNRFTVYLWLQWPNLHRSIDNEKFYNFTFEWVTMGGSVWPLHRTKVTPEVEHRVWNAQLWKFHNSSAFHRTASDSKDLR